MIRLLWLAIVGKWPKSNRCKDLFTTNDYREARCKSDISPLCWDRRCRFHCSKKCKCETADGQLAAVS